MKPVSTLNPPQTWIATSWEDYLQSLDQLETTSGKSYYYQHHSYFDMSPIGSDHACDHSLVNYAVNLYATIQQIDFQSRDNCSYRKLGIREAQPDLSYYIGQQADLIPYGTSIIDLDEYSAPDLVIEIAKSSLADDLGNKRLLYEEMGVKEYWVVDVENARIIAFKIFEQGSQRIQTSLVLPDLDLKIINSALQQSRHHNHRVVCQSLMSQFQSL
ncbi:MAG: Uma2 family endonuclease [Snowella sp.]|nr:Uma2 family endonuclease [Snowella sp.]